MYMPAITVDQILNLATFQSGEPQLVSAPPTESLADAVRWVHILETPQPQGLLSGGEFVLTTASFLDQHAHQPAECLAQAHAFLDALESAGSVALAAEILPERQAVESALKVAAAGCELPVYVLGNRIRFVELTQTVHEKIADARLQEIETDRQIHETFTSLAIESASPRRIATIASTLIERSVQWVPAQSTKTQNASAITHPVVTGEETLGHLVVDQPPQHTDRLITTVLERASQAVSIAVLSRRSQREMKRATASSLFYQLRNGTSLSDQEVHFRLNETFGYPPRRVDSWTPAVFRMWSSEASEEQLSRWSGILLDILTKHGAETRLPVFAARSELGVVEALLPTDTEEKVETLIDAVSQRFSSRIHNQCRLVAGLAEAAGSTKRAAEELVHANQIAQAAQAFVIHTHHQGQTYYRARDLGLRGLLATLHENQQLAAFMATELAGLLPGTATQQEFELHLDFLEAVLTTPNKADLARQLHISRPALYARIQRLEERLGYSIENNAEQRTAAHLAVMAYRLNSDQLYPLIQKS